MSLHQCAYFYLDHCLIAVTNENDSCAFDNYNQQITSTYKILMSNNYIYIWQMLVFTNWCIGECTHNGTEKPILHGSLIWVLKTIHLKYTYNLGYIKLSVLCTPLINIIFWYREEGLLTVWYSFANTFSTRICFHFRLQH